MEIYKDINSPVTQQFEKLLNNQLSKNKIEEGKIIDSCSYSNLIDNRVLPPHGAATLIRRREFVKVGGYNEDQLSFHPKPCALP